MPSGIYKHKSGRKLSEASKQKLRDLRLGKKASEETCEKISKALNGRVSPMKGRKASDETREKMSRAQKGKKHSLETRDKIGKAQEAQKNHSWKGGITPINTVIRRSPEYRLWRTAVFERDKYACIWCGAKNGNGKAIILQADHIKPFAYYPELRFAIDNGRTLCVPCHKTTDTYGGRCLKIKK
jgi:5-methylcytosine-specific restriction endonuclease McrA